jgi:hypothetical protein
MARDERRLDQAAELMLRFAERTGVGSTQPSGRRYLWTDAFAVCNFLGLAEMTSDPRFSELALRLVEAVHRELGRHRADDRRTGWISGLSEEEGEAHPTRGGLRIGKKLPERRPDQAFDEALEWDRDGQYFHYLTKWMHALDRVAAMTTHTRYNLWARELAAAAHGAFVHDAAGGRVRAMFWKMSIDLGRALVPSMGQHDPLDGLLTCLELEATASAMPQTPNGPSLEGAIADYAAMLDPTALLTADPLGVGGLLTDAWRVTALERRGALRGTKLGDVLLAAAFEGLRHFARGPDLRAPASRRLAFRELGLAIGLDAVELLRTRGGAHPVMLDAVTQYSPLAGEITSFWLEPDNQRARPWTEHPDINDVMLATSLAPEGFLAP